MPRDGAFGATGCEQRPPRRYCINFVNMSNCEQTAVCLLGMLTLASDL